MLRLEGARVAHLQCVSSRPNIHLSESIAKEICPRTNCKAGNTMQENLIVTSRTNFHGVGKALVLLFEHLLAPQQGLKKSCATTATGSPGASSDILIC